MPYGRLLLCARLSRADLTSTSIARQLAKLRKFAESKSAIVVDEIGDENVSGAISPFDRPGLGPWLNRPQDYDAIVFPKDDRVTRETLDILLLLDWAEKNDKGIVILEPFIDSRTMTDSERMFLIFGAERARAERRTIKGRVEEQVYEDRQIGKYLGGPVPYWCKLAPHPSGKGKALEIDPVRSLVVLDIIDKVIARKPYAEICAWLELAGIPTPTEGRERTRTKDQKRKRPKFGWTTPSIKAIIRNRMLIGEREVVKRVLDVRGRSTNQVISRTIVRDESGNAVRYCPALISPERWLQAMEVINTPRQKSFTKNRTPLQGVVNCARCKEVMYRNYSYEKKNGDQNAHFRCSNKIRGAGCDAPVTNERIILSAIEIDIQGSIGRVEIMEKVDPIITVRPETLEHLRREADAVESLLALATSEDRKASLTHRWQELDGQIAETQVALQNPPGPEYVATGRLFWDMWEGADWHKRGDLMRALGIKVFADDGSVWLEYPEDIHLRLRDTVSRF